LLATYGKMAPGTFRGDASVKSSLAVLVGVALLVFTGCNKGTEGGPGASNKSNKSHLGQAEETFSLTVPMLSTKLKQGEAKVDSIGIKRGRNFDEDVTLKFDQLPQGVTIEPASPVINHGEKETKITIKAAEDAGLGDFTIKVTGHPTKGAEAMNNLKVTIEKK